MAVNEDKSDLSAKNRPRPRISVVIPTVKGRKGHFERAFAAYEDRSPADTEIIVIEDHETCGEAWAEGIKQARGHFVHITADDLEPAEDWWQAALEAAEAGVQPAACVYDVYGSLESAGLTDTQLLRNPVDGEPVQAAGVPFLAAEWWDRHVAPHWPALHYSTDLLLSFLLERAGIGAEVRTGYALVHHWAMAGRKSGRLEPDFERYRAIRADLEQAEPEVVAEAAEEAARVEAVAVAAREAEQPADGPEDGAPDVEDGYKRS